MTQSSCWLYLPIDVKVREIEAKIFMALRAASRGYKVVIGQKQKFPSVMSCYPAGHYLGFGAIENFKAEYQRLKNRGHGILLLDEEGLVTHSETIYVRNRLRSDVLSQSEAFIAWGSVQAELLKAHRPEFEALTLTSGNPRFDVLRPEQRHLYNDDVQRLKKEHGDFILINSSFGSCNHYTGRENYLQSLRDKKVIQSEKDFSYYSRYFQYRYDMMQEFLKVLPALRTAFPDTRIIVRPHPSENVDTWKAHTEKLGNIHVIHEGAAIPWMLASGASFHNFCTTSLEAFALGLAPIAYRPIIDESLETPLPSMASIETKSEAELVDAIRNVLSGAGDPDRGNKLEAMGSYIANLEGAYASDVILDKLEGLPLPERVIGGRVGPLLHGARKAAEKTKAILRGQGKNAYVTHKFPGLDIQEIREIIQRMETTPGEYKDIKIRMIHDNCALLE